MVVERLVVAMGEMRKARARLEEKKRDREEKRIEADVALRELEEAERTMTDTSRAVWEIVEAYTR